jgi:hypothetical protein
MVQQGKRRVCQRFSEPPSYIIFGNALMPTSTNLFRTAFWAMLLSFGLTMIVVVSDPEATNALALHTTRTSGHERIVASAESRPLRSEDRPRSEYVGLTGETTVSAAETRREAPRSLHPEQASEDSRRPSSRAIYQDRGTMSTGSVTRMAQLTHRRARPTHPQRTTTAATASMARQKKVVSNAQQDRTESLPVRKRQKSETRQRPDRDIPSSQESAGSVEEVEILPAPVNLWRAFAPAEPGLTSERKPTEQHKEKVDIEARLAQLERQIDRIVDARTDRKSGMVERSTQTLQQDQQLEAIKRQLEKLIRNETTAAPPSRSAASSLEGSSSGAGKSRGAKLLPNPEGVERFSLQVQDEKISRVLDMLGQFASLNILVGSNVTGRVSTNLQNVTAEEALKGLLWSRGYSFHRDGQFIVVMAIGFARQDPLARK